MNLRNAIVALAVAATAVTADAQSVRIAERPTAGPFSTIQAAVDAALEGESLIVTPGNYAPFTIDAKSVHLFVTGTSARVKIQGRVSVRNLVAGQSVLLTRLDLKGAQVWPEIDSTLDVSNVAGHVRVEDCFIEGWGAYPYTPTAGSAVRMTDAFNVVLSGCSIKGGYPGFLSGEWPVEGGIGIEAIRSSFAIYDSSVVGGTGSDETNPRGGHGGAACSALSYGLFASNTTFTGGRGGGGDYIGCNSGGDGGPGLRLQNAQAHLLANTLTGGVGGWSSCPPAPSAGQPISASNSVVDHLSGARRSLTATRIVADDALAQVTIHGQPGDVVFLFEGNAPFFQWRPTLRGVWLVPSPILTTRMSQGTIPAGGQLVIQRTFPVVSGSIPARRAWLQALCFDTAGVPTLTGPAHVLSINAASAPDCNGNWRHDFVDVLFGGAPDCDGNLIPDPCEPDCDLNGTPDACEIANGTAPDCNQNGVPDACDLAGGLPDCNANGIPDSCDIASHTSSDTNGNGIPDECEPSNLTWHVDAAAPPGGNGSAGAPFQNLFQGIAVAFHGDTLLLAPGLYVGVWNRNLNLGGRSLTLRSASGPQGCTVDAQGQARVFAMIQGEDVVIEGITFLNGIATGHGGILTSIGGSLVLRDCVFASSAANQGGGALYSQDGLLLAEDCTFTGNRSMNAAGQGGAIEVYRSALGLQDCVFFDNHGNRGGAIYVTQSDNPKIRIAHSSFLGNRATWGGAILDLSTPPAGDVTRIDDCLMAGNTASDDGGALMSIAPTAITSSTFVHNSAGDQGGALHLRRSPLYELHDSVVFQNSAPNGAQIFLGDSGMPAKLLVTYCDVEGGAAGVRVHAVSTLVWGAGNLDLDPIFTDPDGPDNQIGTVLDNDYTLGFASPCIDAGDNGRLALDFLDVDGDGIKLETVPWDLRHLPRRVDQPGVPDTGAGTAPITDMGAYER